jgi:hypothetical protein
MRIHTNLTDDQMYAVLNQSGAPIGFHNLSEHGSRSRDRAFEVALDGSGGLNNTGLYGAGDRNGATWDEWGAFFGALYAADPEAICGTAKRPTYANAEHYHHVTGYRFRGRDVTPGACNCGAKYGGKPANGDEHFAPCATRKTRSYLPTDTHPRHRWVPIDGDYRNGWECAHKAGCSATLPADRYTSQIGA